METVSILRFCFLPEENSLRILRKVLMKIEARHIERCLLTINSFENLIKNYQICPIKRLISLADSQIVFTNDGMEVCAFIQVTPMEPKTVPS